MMQQFVAFTVINQLPPPQTTCMYPWYTTSTSKLSRQGGFSSNRGGSNRDMAVDVAMVIAGAEAEVVVVVGAVFIKNLRKIFLQN